MADDVTIDNGAGTDYDVATDDDGAGNHVQIVKLAQSADGSRTAISADADGMLVNLGANNDVTVTGTVTANLAAGTNNIGDVDILSIAAGDNNIGNVDVVSLPASTNTIEVVGDAAHDAAAAGNPVLIGAEFDDSTPDSVDEGDVGRLRISANRNLYSTIRDAAGNERGANVNASNQLSVSVDNTVTVASHAVTNAGTFATQVDGAALTALQLIDDPVATTASAIPTKGMAVSGTDGTNARVLKTDTSGELQVDVLTMPTVTVNSHAVTNAGTFATQVDGAALTALQKIDDPVLVDDAAFTPGTSSVMMMGAQADEASIDSVNEGDAGAVRMTLDRKLYVHVAPNDVDGLSIFRTLDADETEEEIKATAGKLYGWYIYNDGAAEVYVKFYNATAANTTVGTTTPILTVPIPATSGANVEFTNGITFGTALSIAATTGVADADTAAPAANQVVANIFYK